MGSAIVPRGIPDPRESAPAGSYLTDGPRSDGRASLLYVLQSDYAGVECENVATGFVVGIERVDLAQGWHRVTPAGAA